MDEASILGSALLMVGVDEAELIGGLILTSRQSLAAYLRRIRRAIGDMYPGGSPRSLLRKGKMLLACVVAHRALRSWHAKGEDHTYEMMVERHPLLPARSRHPYLNSRWSVAERMRVVETHYELIKQARVLGFPLDASVLLAPLDHVEQGLSLVLDKPVWFMNEGEVAINLFSGRERIYSLLFTLDEVGGRRVAYVGALQGCALVDAVDRYRSLTRSAHGMRPRDLLFAAFRMLCLELGVARILAVSDSANVVRSRYFRSYTDIFTSHDETWIGYGGVVAESGFYEIPPHIRVRAPDEIPSRKRAVYRRRYAMLEDLQAQVANGIRTFQWRRMVDSTPDTPRRVSASNLQPPSGIITRLKRAHVKTRLLNPLDEFWDRRLGVKTVGFVPAKGEYVSPDWRGHYVPTGYSTIFRCLRQVGLESDDVFIDYGSGLGRVVFAASWLGARRSIGVEVDTVLGEGAEANRRACRHRASSVEFVCEPAEVYRPVDVSVIYLYHPFGAGTLQTVLDNLEADLIRRPRHARLIYMNPVHAQVIDAMPRWRRTATWPAGSRFTRPNPTAFWEWS